MIPLTTGSKELKKEPVEPRWSLRNNLFQWGILLRTASIVLGFICLGLSSYIMTDDKYIKVIEQNEWEEWLSFENAYIAINSLVTLVSLIFLIWVVFSNSMIIRATLSFWQHGLGTIALFVALVFKVMAAVQMEQILHDIDQGEEDSTKNHTGGHSASHHHYILKGVIAGLTALEIIIYINLFVQAWLLQKRIGRAKHARAFLERELQFTDNEAEESKSKVQTNGSGPGVQGDSTLQ